MNECLEKERPQLSQYAPKIMTSSLPVDIIGQFIGPSGKNIKQLCTDYECEIDISEDGKTNIFGTNQEKLDQVKAIVDSYSMKPVVGEKYKGKVDRIMDFGAFVELTPTISGTSSIITDFSEAVQDVTGAQLVTNGSHTGISASYDDSGDGAIDLSLVTENVQDIVGGMFSGNTETGISATYEDGDGTIDLVVATQTANDFTTTLKNKLDGIEASATADQTNAEIRAAVEAATDSNVFTDADHSKLNGIEAGATADQTNAEIKTAYEKYQDADTVDVNLIIAGPCTATHIDNLITIAENRKDAVVFASPERADVVNVTNATTQTSNVKAFFDSIRSSSYVVFDSGYKYTYDKYNDVFRYVPLNGDTAGLAARTDLVADSWFSPAGFNRGVMRGVVKLAYNPNKTQRDELYRARINPVVTMPGQGTLLFGDKTGLSTPSAFDRINVRRLFITLEKAISTASKFQLFEFNDEFTRAQFRNIVEPFLRDVQGRRGITDFSVVCDETNNSPDLVVDRNEFRADIFVKPNRSINFITLQFVATRSGVAFEEVVGG